MDIRKEAGSLRDELARELGTTPRVKTGMPGQLDVMIDGRLVFSKKAARRMPQAGEVTRLAKAVAR